MTLILIVIAVALVFEYINGFHDTANSIATVVSTKVLSPRQAIVMAAITHNAHHIHHRRSWSPPSNIRQTKAIVLFEACMSIGINRLPPV